MNESVRKKIVYGCLVLAIIYGIYSYWPRPNDVNPVVSQPIGQPTRALATLTPSSPPIDTAKTASAPWGADPFRVVAPSPVALKTKAPAPGWRLSGILYNQTYPLAIINGKSVGVGARIKGATVISINRDRVTLDHQGKQYTLTVSKG